MWHCAECKYDCCEQCVIKAEGQAIRKNPQTKDVKPSKAIKTYQVCEFKLHKFNPTVIVEPEQMDPEFIESPLVQELFHAFSGLFTHEVCGRALLVNSHDIERAVEWIADGKHKEEEQESNTIAR